MPASQAKIFVETAVNTSNANYLSKVFSKNSLSAA
jgi:hypothetical protein